MSNEPIPNIIAQSLQQKNHLLGCCATRLRWNRRGESLLAGLLRPVPLRGISTGMGDDGGVHLECGFMKCIFFAMQLLVCKNKLVFEWNQEMQTNSRAKRPNSILHQNKRRFFVQQASNLKYAHTIAPRRSNRKRDLRKTGWWISESAKNSASQHSLFF